MAQALQLDPASPVVRLRYATTSLMPHGRIREAVRVPIFLAGGLRPGNVRQAIDEVGPWGVDLCNGVRTGGRLDAAKLDRFMAAVKSRPS